MSYDEEDLPEDGDLKLDDDLSEALGEDAEGFKFADDLDEDPDDGFH